MVPEVGIGTGGLSGTGISLIGIGMSCLRGRRGGDEFQNGIGCRRQREAGVREMDNKCFPSQELRRKCPGLARDV